MEDWDWWAFIEKWMPGYSSNQDVYADDVLTRYVDGEDVDEDDMRRIEARFADCAAIYDALEDMEVRFFREALHAYYQSIKEKGNNQGEGKR